MVKFEDQEQENMFLEDVIYQCAKNLTTAIANKGSTDDLKAVMIKSGVILMTATNPVLCIEQGLLKIDPTEDKKE